MSKNLIIFLLVCGGLIFFAGHGTGDIGWYLAWSHAFIKADIFSLPPVLISPLGLPAIQWSHGPGLLFALGPFLFPKIISFESAVFFLGSSFILIFWIAFYRVLKFITSGNAIFILLGLGIAFLGTHLGYYSLAHASESISFAFAGLLLYWLVVPRKWKMLDSIMVGICCMNLIVIGSYLVIVCLVALYGLSINLKTSLSDRSTSWALLLKHNLIALFFIGLGIVQILFVNRWMTGSLFRSPYAFGDGAFSSFDFLHPHLWEILFHPWHGLFIYHPWYLLAIIVIAAGLIRQKMNRYQKGAFFLCVLTIGMILYVLAAWYCWWYGLGTFGMRRFGIVAVLLVPFYIQVLQKAADHKIVFFLLLGFTGLCCLWSCFLIWQGETQFDTVYRLLQAQGGLLKDNSLFRWSLLSATGGSFLLYGLIRFLKKPNKVISSVTIFIAILVVGFLLNLQYEGLKNLTSLGWARILFLFFLVLGVAVLIWVLVSTQQPIRPIFGKDVLLSIFLFLSVTATLFLFIQFAITTERHLKNMNEVKLSSGCNIFFQEVEATYREYFLIPGYEAEKVLLGKYIDKMRPLCE